MKLLMKALLLKKELKQHQYKSISQKQERRYVLMKYIYFPLF